MKLRLTELLTIRTQQLIIPVVLSLLFATTAALAADGKKGGPPPPPPPPPPPATNPPPGSFTATGGMNVARYNHKTILLDNGLVLAVTGDRTAEGNSAELYIPATGNWTLTGSPAQFHEFGSVTLLASGQVLLAGGSSNSIFNGTLIPIAPAELYDPKTGRWSTTGSLVTPRQFHAAVLLTNGQVLVAGGQAWDSRLFGDYSIASAELYNPVTGTWQATGSMHESRDHFAAELLGDGTVLVAGGIQSSYNGTNNTYTYLATAEIYDPSTGEWTMTADMPTSPRIGPTQSALLTNGDVLVPRIAFFNPETGTWTPTGASFPGVAIGAGPSTATLLTTGDVLLTGFESTYNAAPPVNTTVLYDFSSNAYRSGASMTSPRYADAATLLPNGQVLVCGGYRYETGYGHIPLSSAELYTP